MKLRNVSLVLATAGTLLVAPFIAAQETAPTQDTTPASVQDTRGLGRHGHGGPGFGLGRGFPLRGLSLGTTATLTFYDGDPAAGGAVVETLTFTYGEDSEAAFAETFQTARANAAYLQVALSEQTRTVDLSEVATNERGDLRPRELGRMNNLNDGSTITAAFYNTDPAVASTTATQTLTFTYGVSSAAGFADDFSSSAEGAQFVTITTSPQTYTVNLADVGRGDRDQRGPGGFDNDDDNDGRGPR
jgi:hypothetical protein